MIKVYTVERNAVNSYMVTETDTIDQIKLIPNHDDGITNPSVSERIVTGILVFDTATPAQSGAQALQRSATASIITVDLVTGIRSS